MKRICRRCDTGKAFEVPFFKNHEKLELLNLKVSNPIMAIKRLIETFKLPHADAKFIVSHINIEYGQYNRCNYNELMGE